jgi:ABC-type amino acid transport substrate-binding protein
VIEFTHEEIVMASTCEPGTLIVASAYPDPPFDIMQDGTPTGFDLELMRAICAQLKLTMRPVRYPGSDFNGIFAGLDQGIYDAVISGTTITPQRAERVLFSNPYLTFNQGVAVNRRTSPHVVAQAGLSGLVAGIQHGNTSDLVARRLKEEGIIADIRYYAYDAIGAAINDLEAGRIGLVIKLFPVISWLIKDRPQLAVAFQVPTNEQLGIAFAKSNQPFCDAVNDTLDALKRDGTFAALTARWFPNQTTRSTS